MKVNERFNLYWMLRAITAPCSYCLEKYYYDLKRKELFSVLHLADYSPAVLILDKFSFRYPLDIEGDIAVRLELIAYRRMKIVEIPRMDISEKIGIQIQFLSILGDQLHQQEYTQAVIQQSETHGFVLDNLLKKYDSSAPLRSYWEHIKLQIAASHINKLILNAGIKINISNVA
jgi:hypothetical protein